jgi:uncharacterized protein (DUF1501 family)
MQRRNFLKVVAGGAALGIAPTLITTSRADGQAYAGPYWVFITALGAWDPRFLFDPSLNVTQNRLYTQLGKIGNISYAPLGINQETLGLGVDTDFTPYLRSNEQFLTRFGPRLTVINGIDTSTNNHETGQRSALSGSNPEGLPAIGSLVAATHGPTQPIAFMSSGGYDTTAGLVPLARITDVDALRNLAFPNTVDPKNAMSESYHTAETFARIRNLQQERLGRLRAEQHLPRLARSMDALQSARNTDNLLSALKIPEKLVEIPSYQLDDLERFQRQAQLAVSGFSAGLVVSANLQLGGFDTHANHDRDQLRQLVKLLGGINFLFDQLEAAGIGQNTYVVVTSDFARGPRYNAEAMNAGKDHWPITSMLLMGPGIAGNRVIGGTSDDQLPLLVDPKTLAVSATGVKITPSAIHRALRQLARVSPDLEQRYPLAGEALPLFS